MESGRKSAVALALSLLIHLLTLSAGDTAVGRGGNGDPAGKIILEEVIVAGSGNNTRIIANAVVEDPTRISDDVLSLLSKRETRDGARSSSLYLDQDVEQTRASIVNVDEDEDDIERLKRVIAKYEPQRIVSRKSKRKIVDTPDATHDIRDASGEVTEPTMTDFERTYHEVLRNISRNVPQLVVNNAVATANPYLSLAMKNLKRIYAPEATIYVAANGDADKPHLDVGDSTYTPRTLKKTKKSPKKYSQPSRAIITSSRVSSVAEPKSGEETADSDESITSREYHQASSETTARPKNGSSALSAVHLHSTERPENRGEWNIRGTSSRIAASPFFASRANDSDAYNAFHVDRPYGAQSNFPSGLNSLRPSPKYGGVPRPFALSRLSDAPDANTRVEDIPYRKPDLSSANVKRVQQATRSSGNILPLILPTELFNQPPVRRYVQIKRADRSDLNENPAAFAGATGSPGHVVDEGTVPGKSAYAIAPYTNVIGVTVVPTIIAADGLRRSAGGLSDYRTVTEIPAERIVARTSFAATAASGPGLAAATPYSPRQQKDSRTVHEKDAPPRIATYDALGDEKSDSKANPGLALYNRFASLYPANVPDAPRTIAPDYRGSERPTPTSSSSRAVAAQPISVLAYATPRPVPPRPFAATSPKTRPTIAAVKPLAPYYDGRFFAPRDPARKQVDGNDDDEGRAKTYEQPRAGDASESGESEEEVADGASGHPGSSRETRINHTAYRIHETPNERLEKGGLEDERQRIRDYGRRDEYHGRHDGNDSGRPEESRREDEKGADMTHEDERSSARDDEDEHDRDRADRYNNYEYRRDDSEEERREGQDRRKYDEEIREHQGDRETDAADNRGYFDAVRYKDRGAAGRDKEYRYDWKEAGRDDRYGKNRRDRGRDGEYKDEGAAEDRGGWSVERQRDRDNDNSRSARPRERQEKKRDDTKDPPRKRKYHRKLANSPKDLRSNEREHKEEYGETNPDQVRQEYRQQRAEADRRDHGGHDGVNRDDGDKNEAARDQVHGQETKEHAEKHHEKKHGGGDHKFVEGEGAEHKEEHHGHAGDKGDKGYKVWNEHEKAEKGHHDKEHFSKEYDEKEGEQKKHEEEDGYHAEHHHDEEGKKEAEFGEKGEHEKGHSTKGQHSVHKKDEYEKKTEFFDEFHEDGGTEKHGEHHHDHESKKGGHEKKAHHDAADHEEKHGKEEKYEKGGHHHEHKGHKVDEGHDHHHDHDRKYGKKEGHESGKKWSYKKGDDGGGGGDHKHDDGHKR